jgi:hypothetical protein
MAGGTISKGMWRAVPWRLLGWGGAALLLLIPAAATQLTPEMDWNAFDFVYVAVLLGGTGLCLELAARKGDAAYLLATATAMAAGALLLTVGGAVGIIGSERGDANALYLGVLAVALLGVIAARFRPAGMAPAMAAAAAATVLVPVIAWIGWPEARAAVLAPEVFGSTLFFGAAWLASAWLFRRSGRDH